MTPELIPGSLGRLKNQHIYKYVKSVINIHSLIQFHFLIVKTIIDATKEARCIAQEYVKKIWKCFKQDLLY